MLLERAASLAGTEKKSRRREKRKTRRTMDLTTNSLQASLVVDEGNNVARGG